jgi:hypothetical protein
VDEDGHSPNLLGASDSGPRGRGRQVLVMLGSSPLGCGSPDRRERL